MLYTSLTSLPPEPSSILYYLELNLSIGPNRPVASLAEGGLESSGRIKCFYTVSVVLFQLHGCVVSHMQVLASVYNIK